MSGKEYSILELGFLTAHKYQSHTDWYPYNEYKWAG